MSRPQSHTTAKTLVQAFISCRLDYCNSLLYGVTDNNNNSQISKAPCAKLQRR